MYMLSQYFEFLLLLNLFRKPVWKQKGYLPCRNFPMSQSTVQLTNLYTYHFLVSLFVFYFSYFLCISMSHHVTQLSAIPALFFYFSFAPLRWVSFGLPRNLFLLALTSSSAPLLWVSHLWSYLVTSVDYLVIFLSALTSSSAPLLWVTNLQITS